MLLWLKVVSNHINASVGSILSSNCDIVVLQGEFLQLLWQTGIVYTSALNDI